MKTRTTLISFIVITVLSGAGAYYAWQSGQSDTQPVEKITQTTAEPEASPSPPAQLRPDSIPTAIEPQGTELANNIAAMRDRQRQRDAQIQALHQSARLPTRLPELPVIEPLQMPADLTTRTQLTDRFDAGDGYTLPQDVMSKFTNETGLSQAKIEQAMNRQ